MSRKSSDEAIPDPIVRSLDMSEGEAFPARAPRRDPSHALWIQAHPGTPPLMRCVPLSARPCKRKRKRPVFVRVGCGRAATRKRQATCRAGVNRLS